MIGISQRCDSLFLGYLLMFVPVEKHKQPQIALIYKGLRLHTSHHTTLHTSLVTNHGVKGHLPLHEKRKELWPRGFQVHPRFDSKGWNLLRSPVRKQHLGAESEHFWHLPSASWRQCSLILEKMDPVTDPLAKQCNNAESLGFPSPSVGAFPADALLVGGYTPILSFLGGYIFWSLERRLFFWIICSPVMVNLWSLVCQNLGKYLTLLVCQTPPKQKRQIK